MGKFGALIRSGDQGHRQAKSTLDFLIVVNDPDEECLLLLSSRRPFVIPRYLLFYTSDLFLCRDDERQGAATDAEAAEEGPRGRQQLSGPSAGGPGAGECTWHSAGTQLGICKFQLHAYM
jgi:hypothetical protein